MIKKLNIAKIVESSVCCKVNHAIDRLNVGKEIIENEIKNESLFENSFSTKYIKNT